MALSLATAIGSRLVERRFRVEGSRWLTTVFGQEQVSREKHLAGRRPNPHSSSRALACVAQTLFASLLATVAARGISAGWRCSAP